MPTFATQQSELATNYSLSQNQHTTFTSLGCYR